MFLCVFLFFYELVVQSCLYCCIVSVVIIVCITWDGIGNSSNEAYVWLPCTYQMLGPCYGLQHPSTSTSPGGYGQEAPHLANLPPQNHHNHLTHQSPGGSHHHHHHLSNYSSYHSNLHTSSQGLPTSQQLSPSPNADKIRSSGGDSRQVPSMAKPPDKSGNGASNQQQLPPSSTQVCC